MEVKWFQAIMRAKDNRVGQFQKTLGRVRAEYTGFSDCPSGWYRPSKCLSLWLYRLRESYWE